MSRTTTTALGIAGLTLALLGACGDSGTDTIEFFPEETSGTSATTTAVTEPPAPLDGFPPLPDLPRGLYQVTGVTTGDVLNVRAAAGVDAAIVDTLDAIEMGVYDTGATEDTAEGAEWWKIVHPRTGTVGWVNSAFLEPGSPMDSFDRARDGFTDEDKCDPRRLLSAEIEIEYRPLAELDTFEPEGDPVDVEAEFAALEGFTLTNDDGEDFDIVLGAGDAAVIEEFLASEPMVCLDAQVGAGRPGGEEEAPLELSDFLADAAAAEVSVDATALAATLEGFEQALPADSVGPSFAEVIAANGVPPEAVFWPALDAAEAAAAGRLPPAQADRAYLERLMALVFYDPGAPAIRGAAEAALDADSLVPTDSELPGDELSISMVFKADPGEFTNVTYAWDPTVRNYGTVQYKGKCAYDGRAQIYTEQGKAKVTLRRTSPWSTHHSTASAGHYSSNLYRSSRDRSTYRAYVYGKATGDNVYYIYGGWTEGRGGGC